MSLASSQDTRILRKVDIVDDLNWKASQLHVRHILVVVYSICCGREHYFFIILFS